MLNRESAVSSSLPFENFPMTKSYHVVMINSCRSSYHAPLDFTTKLSCDNHENASRYHRSHAYREQHQGSRLHAAAGHHCNGNSTHQRQPRRERDVRTSTPSRSQHNKRSSLPRTAADDTEHRRRRSEEDGLGSSVTAASRSSRRRIDDADDFSRPPLFISSRSRLAPLTAAQKPLSTDDRFLPLSSTSRRRDASLDELSDDELATPSGANDEPLSSERIIKIESQHRTVTISDHREPVVTLLTTTTARTKTNGRSAGRKSSISTASSTAERQHRDRGIIKNMRCSSSSREGKDDDDADSGRYSSPSVIAGSVNDKKDGCDDDSPVVSELKKSKSAACSVLPATALEDAVEPIVTSTGASLTKEKTTGNFASTKVSKKLSPTSVGDDIDLNNETTPASKAVPKSASSRKTSAKSSAVDNLHAQSNKNDAAKDNSPEKTLFGSAKSSVTTQQRNKHAVPSADVDEIHADAALANVKSGKLPPWYEARRLRILQDGNALIKQIDLPLPPFAYKIWPELLSTAVTATTSGGGSSRAGSLTVRDDNDSRTVASTTTVNDNATESITVSSAAAETTTKRAESPTNSVAIGGQQQQQTSSTADPRQSSMVQRMRTIDVNMDKINSECYSFLHRRKRFSHTLATDQATPAALSLSMPQTTASSATVINTNIFSNCAGSAATMHHTGSSGHLSSPPLSAASSIAGSSRSPVSTTSTTSCTSVQLTWSANSTVSSTSTTSSHRTINNSSVSLPTPTTPMPPSTIMAPFGAPAAPITAKGTNSGLMLQKSVDSAIPVSAITAAPASCTTPTGGLSLLAASMKCTTSVSAIDWTTSRSTANSVVLTPTTPLPPKQLVVVSTVQLTSSTASTKSKSFDENPTESAAAAVVSIATATTTTTVTATASVTPQRRAQTSSVSSVLQSIKNQKLVSGFHNMSAACHHSSSISSNNSVLSGVNTNKCLSAGIAVSGNNTNSRQLFGVDPDAKIIGKKSAVETTTANESNVQLALPATTTSDDDDTLPKLPNAVATTNDKSTAASTTALFSKRSFERSNTVDGVGINHGRKHVLEEPMTTKTTPADENQSLPAKNTKIYAKLTAAAIVDDESDNDWEKALQLTTKNLNNPNDAKALAAANRSARMVVASATVPDAAAKFQRLSSLPNNHAGDEECGKKVKSDATDILDAARLQQLKRKSKHLGKTPVVRRRAASTASSSSSSSSTNSSSSSSSSASSSDNDEAETKLSGSSAVQQPHTKDDSAAKTPAAVAAAVVVSNDVADGGSRSSSGNTKRRSSSSSHTKQQRTAQQLSTTVGSAGDASCSRSNAVGGDGSSSSRRFSSHRHYHRRRNKKNKHNSHSQDEEPSENERKRNSDEAAAPKRAKVGRRRKKIAEANENDESPQNKKSRREERSAAASSSSSSSSSSGSDDSTSGDDEGHRRRRRQHSRRGSKNIFETPQVDLFASMYDRIKRKSSQPTTLLQQQQQQLAKQQSGKSGNRKSRKAVSTTEDDNTDDDDRRRQSAATSKLNSRKRCRIEDGSVASSTADDNEGSASARKALSVASSSGGGHRRKSSVHKTSSLLPNDAAKSTSKKKERSKKIRHRSSSGAQRSSDGENDDEAGIKRKNKKQRGKPETPIKLKSSDDRRKSKDADSSFKKRDNKSATASDGDADDDDDVLLSKPQLSSSNSSISKQSSASGSRGGSKVQHHRHGSSSSSSMLKRTLSANKSAAAASNSSNVENVWATPVGKPSITPTSSKQKHPRTSEVLPTSSRARHAAAAAAAAKLKSDKLSATAGAKQAASKSAASGTTSCSSTASGSTTTTTTDSDQSSDDDENTKQKMQATVFDLRRSTSALSHKSSITSQQETVAAASMPLSATDIAKLNSETSMLPPAAAAAVAKAAAAAVTVEEVPFSLDWNSELSSTRNRDSAGIVPVATATSREKSVLSDVSSSDQQQHMNYISKKRRATGGSGLSSNNNGGNSSSSVSGDNQRHNSGSKRLASEELMVASLVAATLAQATATPATTTDIIDRRRTISSSSTTSAIHTAVSSTAGHHHSRRDKSCESPPPELLPEVESTAVGKICLTPARLPISALTEQQNKVFAAVKREFDEPLRSTVAGPSMLEALPPQLKPQNTDLVMLDDKTKLMPTDLFSTNRKRPASGTLPSASTSSDTLSESKKVAADVKPTTLLIPEPVIMPSAAVDSLHQNNHLHHQNHTVSLNSTIPAPVIGVFGSTGGSGDAAIGHGMNIMPPVICTTSLANGQNTSDSSTVLDTGGSNLLMRPSQRTATGNATNSSSNSCTFQTLSRESSATPQLLQQQQQQQQLMRTSTSGNQPNGFAAAQNSQQPAHFTQTVFAGSNVRAPNNSNLSSAAQTRAFLQAAAMFNNNNATQNQQHLQQQQQQAAYYGMLPAAAAATQQQMQQHQAMLAAATSTPAAAAALLHGQQLTSLWEQATGLARPSTAAQQQNHQNWTTPSVAAAAEQQSPVVITTQQQNALPRALMNAHVQPAWDGLLSLKNDKTHVRMFFVGGNAELARAILPQSQPPSHHNAGGSEALPLLKISQRMRLEPGQLTMVDLRFECMERLCVLVAYANGRTENEVAANLNTLKTGFISYLQQKQACGIVNQQQNATIHIFPPCDWSNSKLSRFVEPAYAADMIDTPHLFMLITYG